MRYRWGYSTCSPTCSYFLVFLDEQLVMLCKKYMKDFLKMPTSAKLMRKLKVFLLVEINIRNFVKVQFGEGPTFSSVCAAKGLAEVFVFQLLPVHPSVSVQERTLS